MCNMNTEQHTLTFSDKPFITRPRVAGKSSKTTERTLVTCTCGYENVITWGLALTRRLERTGETREAYAARVSAH